MGYLMFYDDDNGRQTNIEMSSYCDRCGKHIKELWLRNLTISNRVGDIQDKYQLCDDCIRELENWMRVGGR